MNKLIKDSKGIWVNNTKKKVSYPHHANIDIFNLENRSFWFKHRNSIILKITKRFPYAENFADIGGGNGLQIHYLSKNSKDKKFFLIEPGYFGCLNAKKRGLNNVFNLEAKDFSFKKHKIGGFGLFDVIEHIKDDKIFLKKEVLSRCKKGSLIYITVPAYNWLRSDVDDYTMHFRRYNEKLFKNLAKNCNLRLVYFSYFFSYLPIFIFLFRTLPYRLWGRKRKGKEIMETEKKQHRIGKFVSFFIDMINKWELKQLNKGTIHFGSSCIAVFRII